MPKQTVTAFYENRRQASDAADRLEDMGVAKSDIQLSPENLTDTQAGTAAQPKGFWASLEEMFGGVSAEALWRPDNSALAFGVELNRVRQRGYESDFRFRDYAVSTGHASVYWDLGQGYQAQLDAGRYLAGDWGGTLTLSRRFRNGWSLGTFATLTDVPFEDFGEGSFDKGIVVSIPLAWLNGRPSRDTVDRTIRPVTRDGGARLNVDGRLYEMTRPLQRQALTDSWGRFWR